MGSKLGMRKVAGMLLALGGAALLVWLTLGARPALACGGFFTRRALEQDRVPALAYEQTLILFDAQKSREEFIREVVFRDSKEAFGFVVPTPSRPTVSALKPSPFAKLRAAFPFDDQVAASAAPRAGGGARAPQAGVQVLEVSQVGSFTAFVLAADDDQALRAWLSKNGFVTAPETQAWLAHYVRLQFFYVAMRYEPHAASTAKTTAETMRISFSAPLPFYPYLEPDSARKPTDDRMLDVWLVAARRYTPVALREQGSTRRWVQPLKPGRVFADDPRGLGRTKLLLALSGDAQGLLPGGELVVQRFADQKRSRAGFGDIVFVPSGPPALGPPGGAELTAFARLLDPSLVGAP